MYNNTHAVAQLPAHTCQNSVNWSRHMQLLNIFINLTCTCCKFIKQNIYIWYLLSVIKYCGTSINQLTLDLHRLLLQYKTSILTILCTGLFHCHYYTQTPLKLEMPGWMVQQVRGDWEWQDSSNPGGWRVSGCRISRGTWGGGSVGWSEGRWGQYHYGGWRRSNDYHFHSVTVGLSADPEWATSNAEPW